MNSGDTVKTTVRLPADLHWKFQRERAVRRLSNERAIREAFSTWIAECKELTPEPLFEGPSSGTPCGMRFSPQERQWVERLLRILRSANDSARALAVRCVIQALSGSSAEDPENQASSAKSAYDFEKRVEQLHRDAKDARRSVGKPRISRKRVGNRKA